jgi:hypothetical protein
MMLSRTSASARLDAELLLEHVVDLEEGLEQQRERDRHYRRIMAAGAQHRVDQDRADQRRHGAAGKEHQEVRHGLFETFDGAERPEGWTVVDNLDNDQVWVFDDPAGRGNLTGGEGGFAIVDSAYHGDGGSQNTELVTPVVDLSEVSEPVVRFRQDLLQVGEVAQVGLSLDGGETWNPARLAKSLDVDSWRQWVYEWDARPGQYTLQVRATDGEGETQTAKQAPPHPSGASGYHTIDVTVA